MFFIKKLNFLNLFNSKKVLQTIVNRFDDDSMVAEAIDCKANVLTDVCDNCLKMVFEVSTKLNKKDVKVVFNFNFVLPPNKSFNPQEVAKRVNNLTNVFVKEFKIGNHSFLKEFGLRERSVTSTFAQRVLSRYILENKGVYQHALEALCSCGSFQVEQTIKNLRITRYYDTYKEWRVFRYKTCNLMFKKSNKAVKGFVKVA